MNFTFCASTLQKIGQKKDKDSCIQKTDEQANSTIF